MKVDFDTPKDARKRFKELKEKYFVPDDNLFGEDSKKAFTHRYGGKSKDEENFFAAYKLYGRKIEFWTYGKVSSLVSAMKIVDLMAEI